MKFLRWKTPNEYKTAIYLIDGKEAEITSKCTYRGHSILRYNVISSVPLTNGQLKQITDDGPFGFFVSTNPGENHISYNVECYID